MAAKTKALILMSDAAIKLDISDKTLYTACVYFHRFNEAVETDGNENVYEPVLVAATCLCLACKVDEKEVATRDIINVFHRAVHPASGPLDSGIAYSALKDSMSQLELIILRFLQFKVTLDNPHRYLLHYLASINQWLQFESKGNKGREEEKLLLSRICWSLLSDLNLSSKCGIHDPSTVAISVIALGLQMLDLEVPHEQEAILGWREALNPKVSGEKVDQIIDDLTATYDREEEFKL